MLVAALAVVVTLPDPPVLRLSVVALVIDGAKISWYPAVGVMDMFPPAVVMPAFVNVPGDVMVRLLLPPPELMETVVAAADVVIAEPLPRNLSAGLLTVSEVPLEMVSLMPELMVIEPLVDCELKVTDPLAVGENVWLPVNARALAPLAETVMELTARVESEIVPVPPMVNAPVLAIAMVPADLVVVKMPSL